MHKQGQQIDAACSNINKIHNDLSVAETLIYNLDSWLNKWNVETPHVHIDVPENNAMVKKSEFPIVYARTQKEKHLPGSLVLSNESVDILTVERNFDISFTLREITEISVHTPWEMTILQLRIGQTGQSVHLIAARLVHILQTLEVMLPGKVNYEDPPGEFEEDAEEKLDGLDLQGGWNSRKGTPRRNGRYGEAPPKRSTFFILQVYKRVEISLAEVFQWVETSVILVCKKRPKRAKRCILLVRKVEENALLLFFIHILKIMQV